jgi:hypothetical protein
VYHAPNSTSTTATRVHPQTSRWPGGRGQNPGVKVGYFGDFLKTQKITIKNKKQKSP